jgi:hypothetical protein
MPGWGARALLGSINRAQSRAYPTHQFLASPADRYGKEVAETENKAKKKLVSHNNGDFNVTRA